MQRPLVFALILLFAAVAGGLWFWLRDDTAPPPPVPGPNVEVDEVSGPAAASSAGGPDGGDPATVREAVATRDDPLLDDPDIRAGLCGFRGRVVDHLKVPVADCGVRMYRGALDSVLRTNGDLFGELPDFEPQYIAGEVRTADDGTFQITGVWPRGFYLLFAGIGTDAPTHQIVTEAPSPGQIVDLGDVVLNDAGVIVGEVYDDEGKPMGGALVRAADIPGALAAFFPAERFDPEGAVLIREPRAPMRVIEMPPWVKRVVENLPIPQTRTADDGSFRLVGVMPGSNMLATTQKGYLSDVKASVQVRAGEEKNVGRIRMRRGEELYAKVLDEKGEPVAGAEVIAGSTLSMVPVDLASHLGKTNAQGEIDGTGFSPGKVTVAARRSDEDAWVLAEPQSIISDVIVTLPAEFGVTVGVQLADGTQPEAPRFRLLRGEKGDGAAEMYMMGFTRPIPVDGRTTRTEDGRWRIGRLPRGKFTLLAEVDGQANGAVGFDLQDADVEVLIELAPPNVFAVRVVDQADRPVRNAAIFAQARGGDRVLDMPVNCGRTGEDGRLTVDKLRADKLRVSAEHPRWGIVNGEAEQGQELLLRMVEPGRLEGTLSENGQPPLPGKFTVAVVRRRSGEPSGPLENVPQLVTAGLDGTFEVTSLQPGHYVVAAFNSLDTLRSPGSVFTLAQSFFMGSQDASEERVDVVSGQTAAVRLEVGKKPLEGPTATLAGSLTVDGRVSSKYMLAAWGDGKRFGAEVDERGRFDFGQVSAGTLHVTVMGSEDGMFMGRGNSLWSSQVELAEGEQRELTIDVSTSSMEGVLMRADGSPANNLMVRASGRLKGSEGRGRPWQMATTDARGVFRFKQVPEGTWSLEAESGDGEERYRVRVEGVEVAAGVPVVGLRLQLEEVRVVRGRVDLSGLKEKPRWGSVTFGLADATQPDGTGKEERTWFQGRNGEFSIEDIAPGTYLVRIQLQGEEQRNYECGTVVVPPAGLKDVVIIPRIN